MASPTKCSKKALAAATLRPVIDPADSLSKLPEEIQAQILSFLPAQEAVRTCVLARTWHDREVWKLTRHLLITIGDDVLAPREVRGFVDRLLRLRLDGLKDHGPVDACKIVLDWCRQCDDDEMDVSHSISSWIRSVLECQVRSLCVHIWSDYGNQRENIIPVSNKSFVSPHLTRLELRGFRFCAYRDTSSMDLTVCPALEYLEITACNLFHARKMMSPSVKRLVIKQCYSSEFQRLQICFPLLVSLWLEDFYDKSLVLESMPQLSVAYVSIVAVAEYSEEHDPDDDEQDIINTTCMVLKGLAEAKHLVLLPDDKTITFTRDMRFCPTYSKLKTLVLNYNWCESADCSALACMLQRAPTLEKLTVLFSRTVESKYDMVVEGRPNATGNSTMM